MKPSRTTCVVAFAAALSISHASVALAFQPSKVDSAERLPLNLGGSSTTAHASTAGSAGGSILRTVIGLVIVVALIYGVTWVLRKVKRGEGRTIGTSLESVASLPLGPGRSLALVRAGSELVLIGVAENQVTPIRRYSEDEARAAGLLIADEPVPVSARVDTLTADGARALSSAMGADSPRRADLTGLVETLRRWTVRS